MYIGQTTTIKSVLSLRTSALNMTLPAAAARAHAAVDPYLLHAPRLQQAVPIDRTDGRSDGHPTVA